MSISLTNKMIDHSVSTEEAKLQRHNERCENPTCTADDKQETTSPQGKDNVDDKPTNLHDPNNNITNIKHNGDGKDKKQGKKQEVDEMSTIEGPTRNQRKQQNKLTTQQMARFASSFAAYRISRLSIDLFLVTYMTSIGFAVSTAGTVYLIFNFVDVITGIINLWTPTVCVGSICRGTTFICLTTIMLVGGFLSIFCSTNIVVICAGAAIAGAGQSIWFVNFQTIFNKSIPKGSIGLAAQLKLLYDILGFLLPSIILAIVNTIGHGDNTDLILQRAAMGLGGISFLLFALGADVIIISAARVDPGRRNSTSRFETTHDRTITEKNRQASQPSMCTTAPCDQDKDIEANNDIEQKSSSNDTVIGTIRKSLEPSIFLIVLLNSFLLTCSAIALGMAGLGTEKIYHLEGTMLWVKAIAFPIGGAVPILYNVIISSIKNSSNTKHHDQQEVVNNKTRVWRLFVKSLVFFMGYVVVVSFLLRYSDGVVFFPYLSNKANHALSLTLLFVDGLFVGGCLATLSNAIYPLWLTRISSFDVKTVSRFNVVDSTVGSFLVGFTFQAHTKVVNEVYKIGNILPIVTTLSLYGPIILILLVGLWILRILPEGKDSVAGQERSETITRQSVFLTRRPSFFSGTIDVSQALERDSSLTGAAHEGNEAQVIIEEV